MEKRGEEYPHLSLEIKVNKNPNNIPRNGTSLLQYSSHKSMIPKTSDKSHSRDIP
jgi:hypothetical protein